MTEHGRNCPGMDMNDVIGISFGIEQQMHCRPIIVAKFKRRSRIPVEDPQSGKIIQLIQQI